MSARVTAQPTMASGAVKIGKSFTGSRQAVGVSGFAGKPLKARAVSMVRTFPLSTAHNMQVSLSWYTNRSASRRFLGGMQFGECSAECSKCKAT